MKYFIIPLGIVISAIIWIVGAAISKKWRIDYGWFSILSFANFMFVGYLAAFYYSFDAGFVFSGALGVTEGIIGLEFNKRVKPFSRWEINIDPYGPKDIFFMIVSGAILGAFFGFLGSLLV